MYKIILALFGSSIIQQCNSARILGVIPSASYSHQVVYQPLWRKLSLRGHQLTVLTTDPMKDPSLTNLTEIDLHFSYEVWNKQFLQKVTSNNNVLKLLDAIKSSVNEITNQQLQHPQVQAILKNETEHFDLLMVEFLMPAMFAFAERFKCPFIGMVSLDATYNIYEDVGNPAHPALNPDINLPFAGQLTFFERLISTVYKVFGSFSSDQISSVQQIIVQKHFGNDYPQLKDITKNVSLLFTNSDQIFYPIRPLVPAVIQIGGGTHRKPAQPLPKSLQKLLDSASQGFIYFSLGSNVKNEDLSESIQKILLETFAELPYLVLWKFECEDLPNKPENVFISKWFPQQDIFRHANIKLFITQGGYQSIEEAIYSYIPILGMPFFGDQPGNINRIVTRGLGLSVDYMQLEKESFKNTIMEVINNPKYRKRVKELASLAQDQPMTGLERAVWWTEYVLRHKGARHLRSPVLDLPLYQYFLLDVIGFCLFIVSVLVYLLIILIRIIFRLGRYFMCKPKEKLQ